jgi:membrane-anchored glycerophosphoryl diester phosphodiesterase (GDPDase)
MEALVSEPADLPPGLLFNGLLGEFIGFFGLTLLLSIAGLLVNSIVVLALVSQSAAILHGEVLSLGGGIRRGMQRLWRLIGMGVLQWLVYVVVTIAIVVPVILFFGIVLVGGAWAGSSLGGGDSPIVLIGAVLLVISGYLLMLVLMATPTVYLSARWIAAVPGLVIQDWGATEALRCSWRLTRGQVWRCIGYRVLLFLLMGLVISAPVGVLQQILLIALPSSAFGTVTAVVTALSAMVNVLWQPFYVAAIVLLYYDLRVRREGYDLALQVARLESELRSHG